MSTLNPLFSKPIISYSKTCFFFDKFLNKCAIIADNANNKTTNPIMILKSSSIVKYITSLATILTYIFSV